MAIITGDLNPKRIQLLKEAVPRMTRLAVLEDKSAPSLPPRIWPAIEAASRQEGLHLLPPLDVRRPEDLDRAFAEAARQRAGGMLVLPSAFFSSHSARIVRLAARVRLPAIYEHEDFAEPGGLLSYGPSHRQMFRRLAVYVDKILKGASPGELPVEQPTTLELVINLKTAKTLGLEVLPSLISRADRVLE